MFWKRTKCYFCYSNRCIEVQTIINFAGRKQKDIGGNKGTVKNNDDDTEVKFALPYNDDDVL